MHTGRAITLITFTTNSIVIVIITNIIIVVVWRWHFGIYFGMTATMWFERTKCFGDSQVIWICNYIQLYNNIDLLTHEVLSEIFFTYIQQKLLGSSKSLVLVSNCNNSTFFIEQHRWTVLVFITKSSKWMFSVVTVFDFFAF